MSETWVKPQLFMDESVIDDPNLKVIRLSGPTYNGILYVTELCSGRGFLADMFHLSVLDAWAVPENVGPWRYRYNLPDGTVADVHLPNMTLD